MVVRSAVILEGAICCFCRLPVDARIEGGEKCRQTKEMNKPETLAGRNMALEVRDNSHTVSGQHTHDRKEKKEQRAMYDSQRTFPKQKKILQLSEMVSSSRSATETRHKHSCIAILQYCIIASASLLLSQCIGPRPHVSWDALIRSTSFYLCHSTSSSNRSRALP